MKPAAKKEQKMPEKHWRMRCDLLECIIPKCVSNVSTCMRYYKDLRTYKTNPPHTYPLKGVEYKYSFHYKYVIFLFYFCQIQKNQAFFLTLSSS